MPAEPRLLLLNGPPACGKSTIAQLYVDQHPLALNLDVDRLRRLIGCWLDEPRQSGLLARQLALAAAKAHLGGGHDVVVPQYLAKPAFIEQLETVAANLSATFHEVVLMTSREVAVRRFADRTLAGADPAHVEAAVVAERDGGPDPIGAMYDRLQTTLTRRPHALLIPVVDGDAMATYLAVVDAISR